MGNQKHIQTTGDVHSVNTRYKHCLHKPTANLTFTEKVHIMLGPKIYNRLPFDLKCLMNEKH